MKRDQFGTILQLKNEWNHSLIGRVNVQLYLLLGTKNTLVKSVQLGKTLDFSVVVREGVGSGVRGKLLSLEKPTYQILASYLALNLPKSLWW